MGTIKTLSIDIETFSDVDLQKCGVYKYAQSPNFEILLFGVSVNASEVMFMIWHREKNCRWILLWH